ncbi:transmembrane protein 51-like isoform 1-T1 [Salvelinus alpinus]|uniref:Transmembrane protein 51-like n=1 Tax=Salvelinus namaycush TaxID=8040 RepID=A0A8U1EYF5_SALNM|nr:transmembrane protein 51-like [Salvelinus namaycush]
MRSTGTSGVPPNPPVARNHNNSPGNSGSQYALCALGVGLVALGIVMIVWSVVPSDTAGNNSGGTGGGNPKPDNRGRASSVAFVLVGAGVVMLMLSLCLGMRNKQREQRVLQEAQTLGADNVAASEEDGETAEERTQRYTVPSYEEAVGSGQYPIRQSHLRHSSSQLPSYDDLVDGVQIEVEGSEVTQMTATSANPASSAAAPNHHTRRTGLNLLPLKIQRIKSEKIHMKNTDNSQLPGGMSIEPLTPPPMYEDKVPQL